MSFKVIPQVLGAAVAINGTFTVTYPTGYSKGSFIGGHKHKMIALQNQFLAPTGFTVSLGTTTATITYLGATTLPIGTTVYVQLDMPGADNFLDTSQVNDQINGVTKVSPRLLNLGSPITSSTTSLLNAATGATNMPATSTASKTFTFASTGGTAPLNGANTTGILDVPRNLVMTVTHASSVHAVTAEITSLDVAGNTVIEDLVGTEGATSVTVNGVKAHSQVQTIKISCTGVADPANTTVSIGHGNVLGLPIYLQDAQSVMEEVYDNAAVSSRNDTVALPYFASAAMGATAVIISPVAGRLSKVVLGVQKQTTLGTFSTTINSTTVAGLAGTINPTISNITTNPVFSVTPTNPVGVSTVVAVGDVISVVPSTDVSSGLITGFIEIQPTKVLRGTLVAGNSTTTQSATSADPRGTYLPATTPDGIKSYSLLVLLPDGQSQGVAEWATANALA